MTIEYTNAILIALKEIGLKIDISDLAPGNPTLNHNNKWDGTDYFCKEKKMLHFTSLYNLFSIINERAIRMYSMNHPTDIYEFSNAGKILFKSKNIENFKNEFLYTSFSNKKNINNPILWRLYGYEGKGVCLLFEIENDPSLWECFHFGKVIYENNKLIKLKERIDQIVIDKSENKIDLIFALQRICSFHKRKFYTHEDEIRLITYHHYNNLNISTNNRNIITKYIHLPLVDNSNKNIIQPYPPPKIRLRKIILGYEIDIKLKDKIKNIAEEKLNYNVEVIKMRHP